MLSIGGGLLFARGTLTLEPHFDIQKSDEINNIPVSVYYSFNSGKVTKEGILELDVTFQGDKYPKIYAYSDFQVKKSVPPEVIVYFSLVTKSCLEEVSKKFTFKLPKVITDEPGCNINIYRKNPNQTGEWVASIVSKN